MVAALVMKDTEKAELTKDFLASVPTAKTGPQECQTLEVTERVKRKEDFPMVRMERQVHKPTIIRTLMCNHSISQP